MSIQTIPLDQLQFGHEAVPPINARKVGRKDDIEPLAASILAHGLGQALTVRVIDGGYFVADGNRRLAAMCLAADRGNLPADWPVKIDTTTSGDAGELSLALNIERAPMHEADQYEKFVELHRAGMTAEQISARFGIDKVRITKMLALGALAPVILDAWRNDDFGRDSTDIVRAFTLAPSVAEQERVYAELTGTDRLTGHMVRQAFGARERSHAGWLEVVGLDAYRAAGGSVTEDLFGDNHVVSDAELLRGMLDEKLVATRQGLIDDGWAWVEFGQDLPYSWSYAWEKLHLKPGQGTAEQKAASGCVLNLTHYGKLEITYGVKKPKASKSTASGAAKPEGPALISNAVMQRLSVQLTAAAKDAIKADPKTALAAVLAGLMAGAGYTYGGIPVRVSANGILKEGRQPEDFSAVFAGLLEKSTDDLLIALAAEAGTMLDMSSHNNLAPPLGKPVNSRFVDALDADALQEALRSRFEAEDYFRSVPKSFTLTAIREALGEDPAKTAEKLKKGDLVKFALANVPPTGWLPPELRTTHYGGPPMRVQRPARRQKARLKVAA